MSLLLQSNEHDELKASFDVVNIAVNFYVKLCKQKRNLVFLNFRRLHDSFFNGLFLRFVYRLGKSNFRLSLIPVAI